MTPTRGEPGVFFGFLSLLSIILSLVVYVLLGIWIYKDAEKRKKSGVLWLLVYLLTGILGIIIWLIVRPKETKKE